MDEGIVQAKALSAPTYRPNIKHKIPHLHCLSTQIRSIQNLECTYLSRLDYCASIERECNLNDFANITLFKIDLCLFPYLASPFNVLLHRHTISPPAAWY
ncbi:hypothetical protein TWF225_002161 [Orbilia oligospora]|nr:hypothetical protein TWF225_002161 [Orbilia oligospora]